MSSWRRRKWSFLVLTLLLYSIVMVMISLLQPERANRLKREACGCSVRSDSETFTRVPGSRTLLINAFREHRTPAASVRLLAIVPGEERSLRSSCVFCCQGDGEMATATAQRTTHRSNYFFPYGTGDFLCLIPPGCEPRFVGLLSGDSVDFTNFTLLPVLNRAPVERPRLPLRFTLCIANMFNSYDNVLQFVQAMELYRLLGIQRVIVYKTSCSATMDTVLDYYSRKSGFLQVRPWPIDAFLKPSSSWTPSLGPGQIHYYGQIPSSNDCLYRSMYQSRYVLMHDADEVILPAGNVSFQTLISDLEKAHGEKVNFYFPNNVFPYEEKEENSRFDFPEWRNVPGSNFLGHVLRELDTSGYNTGKLVLDPRGVLQMEVHSVHEHIDGGRTERVGRERGQLYHVRRRKNNQQGALVRDEGLLKVAGALVERVNHALSSMGLLNTTAGPAPTSAHPSPAMAGLR
ncbi:uncharacterized protein LOC115541288 [Gadus morhua]|uniref:uncharacterized protein LOC115541288 n=1 Tax=Gadus morhua TaxID=8049 RepID=UPI0011B4E8A4|nr:uncharacterized protein LOC115541288 [Gadus morhua]